MIIRETMWKANGEDKAGEDRGTLVASLVLSNWYIWGLG
jgi:hypothetical protein